MQGVLSTPYSLRHRVCLSLSRSPVLLGSFSSFTAHTFGVGQSPSSSVKFRSLSGIECASLTLGHPCSSGTRLPSQRTPPGKRASVDLCRLRSSTGIECASLSLGHPCPAGPFPPSQRTPSGLVSPHRAPSSPPLLRAFRASSPSFLLEAEASGVRRPSGPRALASRNPSTFVEAARVRQGPEMALGPRALA
jgi:hypothetical protein